MRLAITILLVGAGCDTMHVGPSAEPRAGEGEPSSTLPEPVDPGDRPCEELTREECLQSLLCTLDAPAGGTAHRYVCRPSRGNCEVGLRQIPADRERCEARDGCEYAEPACYCGCRGSGQTAVPDGTEAPECDCECGGGPPARCHSR